MLREEANFPQRTATQNSDVMDIERDSDAPLSASNCLAIGHETPRSVKVNDRPKNGSSKAFALLDSLIERKERDYGGTAASRPLDTVGIQHTRVEVEATPSKVPSWLIDEISRLDHLLIQADNVSAAINSCYWSIGVSYREFCKVSSYSHGGFPVLDSSCKASHAASGEIQHPRTMEKDAFARFCATPPVIKWMEQPTARARLQKRLQRARKFVILVDIFGEQVLEWVPEISVSRLDLVRLEDLQKIASGSIEQKRVQIIKNKLPGRPVVPMVFTKSSC